MKMYSPSEKEYDLELISEIRSLSNLKRQMNVEENIHIITVCNRISN